MQGNPLPLRSDKVAIKGCKERAIRKMSGQGDISAVLRLITVLPHGHGNCCRDRLTIRTDMAAFLYFLLDSFYYLLLSGLCESYYILNRAFLSRNLSLFILVLVLCSLLHLHSSPAPTMGFRHSAVFPPTNMELRQPRFCFPCMGFTDNEYTLNRIRDVRMSH